VIATIQSVIDDAASVTASIMRMAEPPVLAEPPDAKVGALTYRRMPITEVSIRQSSAVKLSMTAST
jgi:hypothetical protein